MSNVSRVTELIDYVMVTSVFDPSKLRLVLCGDFNGLHQYAHEISNMTHLLPVVTTPTRGMNILDQLYVNAGLRPKSSSPNWEVQSRDSVLGHDS